MRFGVIVDDHKAEIHEHPIPELNDNQVLIRNKVCNLCTTDYQQWMGLRPHQKKPMAFGHENAGVVHSVGKNVKNVKVGDSVVTNIYQPCMECENCRKDKNSMLCLHSEIKVLKMDEFGYYGSYGCSEYKVADSKYVFKIDSSLPFEQMAFCEPLATVVHGIKQLNIKPAEKVLVIGAGTMGMLNAWLSKLYGAFVIISDISNIKLKNANAMGFDKLINPVEVDYIKGINELTNGTGVDTVIIAVGASSAYKQALDVSGLGGKLLIFAAGYPKPEWDLDPNLVHYKFLNIVGTYGCRPSDFQYASELLGNGYINVERLIQARYPLDEIQNAFEAASQKDAYRVSVML
jgi:threonine dehydrogenase-like Zn-dependent dehydrogenase